MHINQYYVLLVNVLLYNNTRKQYVLIFIIASIYSLMPCKYNIFLNIFLLIHIF
nr:MAG TPA: hypothetical protein [Caudoviricetes sp.]